MGAPVADNLLISLYKWVSRQEENFTTESFCFLLRGLLRDDVGSAGRLLSCLTASKLALSIEDAHRLRATTQVTVEEGRPDLIVSGPTLLLVLEAKVGSEVDAEQLSRYLQYLESEEFCTKQRFLVILTRDPITDESVREMLRGRESASVAVAEIRWHHIAGHMEADLNSGAISDPTNVFLVRQFVGFLKERRMTMERVGWELIPGIKSFLSLMEMLGETVRDLPQKKGGVGGDYYGYYLIIPGRNCWTGLYYDDLSNLTFEAYDLNPAQAEKARLTGVGSVKEQGGNLYWWINKLGLASEEEHFFALSKEHQVERIEKFIRKSVDIATIL